MPIGLRCLVFCVLVAACGPEVAGPGAGGGSPRPGGDVGKPSPLARYVALSTAHLWSLHRTTPLEAELFAVEAILGQRGETRNGRDYLGLRTAGKIGVARFGRSNGGGAGDDADCDDFPDAATAQALFLSSGGPSRDPHDLDRDGDGMACEWGTHLRRISGSVLASARATQPRRAYIPPRRYTGGGTCHTGPRGGTYTITASGNKNYSGC